MLIVLSHSQAYGPTSITIYTGTTTISPKRFSWTCVKQDGDQLMRGRRALWQLRRVTSLRKLRKGRNGDARNPMPHSPDA
ncbi:MAG TPA: hypothetical protein VN622_18460 [Clostridia bacterium]|nr:hypothetical protein [Clostridia bacterium]